MIKFPFELLQKPKAIIHTFYDNDSELEMQWAR